MTESTAQTWRRKQILLRDTASLRLRLLMRDYDILVQSDVCCVISTFFMLEGGEQ